MSWIEAPKEYGDYRRKSIMTYHFNEFGDETYETHIEIGTDDILYLEASEDIVAIMEIESIPSKFFKTPKDFLK